MEYFTEFGIAGLFIAAFLAATILPLSSEVVLSFLLIKGLNPVWLITIATLGNVAGSAVNYALGLGGSLILVKRVLRISEEEFARAKHRFEKYGLISLLFAWVPVIGDPITVVAGVMRVNPYLFLLLVTAGKLARYVIISYVILSQSQ